MTIEHRGPPPVEPMSDVAWARVERGLWVRLDAEVAAPVATPPRRWIWIVAPTMAAAAAAILVLLLRPSSTALTDTEPSRVVAGAAPSSIMFGDAHITLDAHSAIVMNRETGAPVTLVERGAAWFTVAHREDRPPFIVRAGDTVVRVVGTKFRVARSEERIAVQVERGLVAVQFRGTEVMVSPNQSWSSERPLEVQGGAVATPTPAPAPAEPALPEPAPVAPVPEPATPKPGHTPRPARDVRRPDVQPAPTPDPVDQTGSNNSVSDADRETYDRLIALESRDPGAALSGYLKLSRSSSRWGELALYAAGRLAADRKDSRAQAFLEIYLRRFPSGANASDARKLLDRLKGEPIR
ncbi:MAG: FecR domain-containing protein [Kofleriaceae bacterium]